MPANSQAQKLIVELELQAKNVQKQLDAINQQIDDVQKNAGSDIKVGVDTKTASRDVDTFADKLKGLTAEDQVLTLTLRAAGVQNELDDLHADLATLDSDDATIDVTIPRINELEAELDSLKTKIKEVADTPIDQGGLGGNIDGVTNKLGGMKDRVAETQGAVHSLAGTAIGDFAATATGVSPLGEAISQITEKVLEGGVAFKELASAAVSVALIAAAIGVLTKVMSTWQEKAKQTAEIKAFQDDDVKGFTKSLTEGTSALDDYIEKLKAAGKIDVRLDVPLIDLTADADHAVKSIANISDALIHAGTNAKGFASAVTGTDEDMAHFTAAVSASNASATEQAVIIDGAANAHEDYKKAVAASAKFNALFTASADSMAAAAARFALENKPIEDMPEQWKAIAEAAHGVIEGQQLTAEQQAIVNQLMTAYGLTSDQVLSRGAELWDKNIDAAEEAAEAERKAAEAAAEHAKELSEAKAEMDAYKVSVEETSVALADMDSGLSNIGRRKDALADVFELDTGPRDARSILRDVGKGITDLKDKAKGVKVGDILKNSVKADDFLDAIDSLAPEIQEAITNTFGDSGPEAAEKMANSYIDQVTKQLGGRFSRAQVAKMLGLDNIHATIQAGVDRTAAQRAKEKLALLVGLTGESVLTADLQLALDAKTLTPQQIEAYVDQILAGQGVTIPGTVELPQDQKDQLAAVLRAMNLPVPSSLLAPPPLDPATLETTTGGAPADVGTKFTPPELLSPTIVEPMSNGAPVDIGTVFTPPPAVDPNDWPIEIPPFAVATTLAAPTLGPWAAADAGSLGVEIPGLSVPVTANTTLADADISAIVAGPHPTEVDVDADTTSADTKISDLVTTERSTTIDVNADTTDFVRDSDTARTNAGKPITVTVKYVPDASIPTGAPGGTTNGTTAVPGRSTTTTQGTEATTVRPTRQILRGRTPRGGTYAPASFAPVAAQVTNVKTAQRQLDNITRPRTARISVALVPSSTLIRVNGEAS